MVISKLVPLVFMLRMPFILRRALFHIFLILSIPLLALFSPREPFLMGLGIIVAAYVSFDFYRLRDHKARRWFYNLFQPLLKVKERSHITSASYALIASIILFLAFPVNIGILSLSLLAVGDAVAALVGHYLGRKRLFARSLEGHLACFAVCILTGFTLNHLGLGISMLIIVAGSIGATIAESIPLRINDNLTIPLFSGIAIIVAMQV